MVPGQQGFPNQDPRYRGKQKKKWWGAGGGIVPVVWSFGGPLTNSRPKKEKKKKKKKKTSISLVEAKRPNSFRGQGAPPVRGEGGDNQTGEIKAWRKKRLVP